MDELIYNNSTLKTKKTQPFRKLHNKLLPFDILVIQYIFDKKKVLRSKKQLFHNILQF